MKDKLLKLIESIDTDNVLTVEQKSQLEQFGESVVTKLNEEREVGYNEGFDKSKGIAESYVAEYEEVLDESLKSLFESVDTLIEKRSELAIVANSDNDIVVEKLDDYLNAYIQESMPESLVVDYKKLQRMTKMVETLKDTMLISDDDVHAKAEQVIENIKSSETDLKESVQQKDEQLQEEMEKRITLQRELNTIKSSTLLDSKLEDIPVLESTKLRKHFNNATVDDINETFESVYETIKDDLKSTKNDVDVSEKIKSIIADVEKPLDDEKNEEDDETDEPVVESAMDFYANFINKLEK